MALRSHTELDVYKRAFAVSMRVFELSKNLPPEEKYSLTDQMRRSSRSVCSNLAEAWRKRRYEAAFISKLNDSEGEAAETQVWIQYAVECQYLDRETAVEFYTEYDAVLGMLVNMIVNSSEWIVP
jgi:four helix bundle protein